MKISETVDYVVLGGGAAGLTMARELAREGRSVVVVERGRTVGGLSRTFRSNGFSFDLGGHRFHSNNPEVVDWLKNLMGADLLTVPRLSRIYMGGKFVDYPVRLAQAMSAFGLVKATQIGLSYAATLARNHKEIPRSFEEWVVQRFGRTLYSIYFKPYTQKVWGIGCDELSADWASQRISLPSLTQTIRQALIPGRTPPPTIVPTFFYPRHGYGTIMGRLEEEILGHGGTVLTSTSLEALRFGEHEAEVDLVGGGAGEDSHLRTGPAGGPDGGAGDGRGEPDGGQRLDMPRGERTTVRCRRVISSIPVEALLKSLSAYPDAARAAAELHLVYRGLILIYLALNRKQISPDHWTYFPGEELTIGRSHEPKNWSPAMVPDERVTSLSLEIFSSEGEPNWQSPDEALLEKAIDDLGRVGWVRKADVLQTWVLRVPYAYPVYYLDYQDQMRQLHAVLEQWPRLSLVGRTGSFRYMNVDGVVEDCFRLLRELRSSGEIETGGLHGVRPLEVEEGRWQ